MTALRVLQRQQAGAATLVVVMMLFLVMALLAAYANRSLMFEQRLAGSYYRSSVSQEVAEAGIEWTLAQLNGTAVDGACLPVDESGQRFADRYLKFSLADRVMVPISIASPITADCARNTLVDGWTCRCPTAAALAVRVPATPLSGTALMSSFGVGIAAGQRPGTLKITSRGCNDSVVDNCAGASSNSTNQLSRSDYSAVIALVGAVRTPPAAPLVVKGDITMSGTGLGLHNTDAKSAGLLVVTGGTWTTPFNDSLLESVPGTASTQVRVDHEPTLTALNADAFKMFMGAAATRYVQHPSLRVVQCNGDCAGAIDSAYKAGKRILWVKGPLTIGSNKVLGTADDPVLVVADGAVQLSGPFQLNGMLVSIGDLDWTNTSGLPSVVTGSVLVTGNLRTNGRMDIAYQQKIADHLRNRMGSYVRAPGGWIDGTF